MMRYTTTLAAKGNWNGVSPVKDFGKSPARTKESPPENERRSLTA